MSSNSEYNNAHASALAELQSIWTNDMALKKKEIRSEVDGLIQDANSELHTNGQLTEETLLAIKDYTDQLKSN